MVPSKLRVRMAVRAAALALALAVSEPAVAQAGMPSFTLTDLARMRVQNLSFFLAGLLLAAGLIQALWNYLRRDFPVLPRLPFGKALGIVVLWGFLFVLVLTMISGARELLTPGAWEKQGATYRLAERPAAQPAADRLDDARSEKLERLRAALWAYADRHDGRFPPDRSVSQIPKEAWQVPDVSGMQYLYLGGLVAGRGATPLAYEPEIFSPQRLVLLTNGEIRQMESRELSQALPAEKP